jgi:hypothetical protein
MAKEEFNCLKRCSPRQLEKQLKARRSAEQIRASRAKNRQSADS